MAGAFGRGLTRRLTLTSMVKTVGEASCRARQRQNQDQGQENHEEQRFALMHRTGLGTGEEGVDSVSL